MQKKQLDPYEVLGVKRDADPETIKAAYRRQAKAHHPDTGGDKDRFAEATLAYDVLMDEKRRKLFDEQGKIDDSPVDAKRNQAKQVIYDMLAHALMGDVDPLSVNLTGQIETNLAKQWQETVDKANNLRRALERAKAMETRFHKKKKKTKKSQAEDEHEDEGNIFAAMLKRHQDQINQAMTWNDDRARIIEIAQDIVKQYDFTMNSANAFTIRYYGGTGGATGSGFSGLF